MNPLNEHSSTKDQAFDHLIAFLVILGAIAFILQQSFSDNTSNKLVQVPTKQELPPAITSSSTKEKQPLSYYEQRQAKRDFEERSIEEWTDGLEEQEINNTSFQIPKKSKNLVTPIAAATTPLVTKIERALGKTPRNFSDATLLKESPPKDKQVFIATDIAEGASMPNAAQEGLEAAKAKQLEAKKQIKKKVNKPIVKEKSPTNIAPKRQVVPKEKRVASYEATTLAIAPKKEEFVEKGISTKKSAKKKKTTKKVAKKSCAVMVAALQDAENIKRLVKSLKSDNYTIYNRRSGKYRAIGVRTSCTPSTYQPILQKIQKEYTADAWLKKL